MSTYEQSVTVNAPIEEVYSVWANLENLPRIMRHIQQVRVDGNRSYWKAEIAGREQEWTAETVEADKNRSLAWRSIEGLENSGRVLFEPMGGDQTVVSVTLDVNPPYGLIGDIAEKTGVGAEMQNELEEDLTRFKKTIESEGIGYYNRFSDTASFSPDFQPEDITTTDTVKSLNNMSDQATRSVIAGGMNPDVIGAGTQLPTREVSQPDVMGPGKEKSA